MKKFLVTYLAPAAVIDGAIDIMEIRALGGM